MRPPIRIETPRLILRWFTPCDAAPVVEAITDSLEHLRAWMPWAANEPVSIEEKARWLASMQRSFLLGRTLAYGIWNRDERTMLGACGLHRRIGAGAIEIGYWIGAAHLRRGFAAEATSALTRIAFEQLNMRRVEVHCEARNGPSAGVARRAGFIHHLTIARCVPDSTAPLRDAMYFSMDRRQYAASPAAGVPIVAMDERAHRSELPGRAGESSG